MSDVKDMHIDLTGEDDDGSLSELSDTIATPPTSKTPPKSAAPSSSSKKVAGTAQLSRSGSSSSLSKSSIQTAPKPRSGVTNKQNKEALASKSKAPKGNVATVDEVVSSRTHVNTGEEGSPIKLCHHHHQPCKGALLECTFMRAPGKRCQKRYCFSVLRRIYDQDPDTIVRSGRLMIDPAEHCPLSEAKYAWKCPGCRGNCQCAVCRKAIGLSPLGQWNNLPRSQLTDAANATDTATKGIKPAQSNKKNKLGNLLEKGAPGKLPSAKDKDKDAIDVDATPSASNGSAKKKAGTLALTPTAKPKVPVFKRLIPPTELPAPSLEVISTKLPDDNLRSRMWIYESFVRFDKVGLSRSALNQLDKFDSWTHALVQEMLACLLKTIAGLPSIDKGQPTKAFVHAITAYRRYGKELQRGEPWSAAKRLLSSLGIVVAPLEFVDHSVPVEVEVLAARRSPSPLPLRRATRARRAKESNHTRLASQMSMLNDWEENGYDDLDEDEDEPPRKRTRGNNRKSIYVYDEDIDDSDADVSAEDAGADSTRRSSRARKPVTKAATPEVRLTGRQQTLRIQQEQQRETEEQTRRETQSRAQERQQAAMRRTSPDVSDVSMDEAKSDAVAAAKSTAIREDDEHDDIQTANEAAPDLESKVAILHSLVDATLMAEPLSEELKTAADNIAAMERTQKVEHAEMEKEIAEELAELNKRAPSIVAPEHQVWKAEKAQLETDIAWRRLDSRVITGLAVDTHSLRTGPLGTDADGREYWHLREYQERMPKFTEGRYAWSLIVLGKAFPFAHPAADKPASEAEINDVGNSDAGNDSGLTSLDSDIGSNEAITKLTPSKINGSGVRIDLSVPDNPLTVKQGGSLCMGSNDPVVIKTLADYVSYRLQQIEYEENQAMQDREREARMSKEVGESGSQPSSPSKMLQSPAPKLSDDLGAPESMYAIRKAKQQQKESQEERRNAVQLLIQRLHKSKDYFAWHRMELPPPGPATTHV